MKMKIIAEEVRKNREVADKISGSSAPPAIEVTKTTASKSDAKSTSKSNK